MNNTFKIYYADMAHAVRKEKKTRPVVVTDERGNEVKVHCVTCRNKQDRVDYYMPLNHFLVSGNVELAHYYWIEKRYLLNYVRDCTTTERDGILQGEKRFTHTKELMYT